MPDIIELSEIDLNNNLDIGSDLKSTNFGSGIELLMNDKVKEATPSSDNINIDDLNKLENELNDLSDINTSTNLKSDFLTPEPESIQSVKFQDDITIGKATATTAKETKTWDGFDKFNDVPINPDKQIPSQPQMSKEELLREKFKFLRKLEALEKKGVELSKKYDMESSLQEMQGEYETIMDEKSKSNSIKFQGNMLMACINGIEFLNGKFDPFDIKLDGWGEQVNENINDYDEIFSELYEKYKSKAKMAPELKLLFQLGGSAMMVHMTNSLFKTSMPGMDDILRDNPDLMKSFQSAAVNSMSQSNPGFSGFMSNMMDQGGAPQTVPTQGPNAVPAPRGRPGNNSMDTSYTPRPYVDDGINLRENNESVRLQERSSRRPEMKGPSDITDILSGLKTKNINIQDNGPIMSNGPNQPSDTKTDNSTISISDLKSLQSEVNLPKKSKRKQKSATNTISLDI
jgi:hypothetical protein